MKRETKKQRVLYSEYADKKVRRWLFTMNNPIFKDSGFKDIDISKTQLEVVEDAYDPAILKKIENTNLFEFHYIQKHFDEENKDKVIKRPFFKDLDSVQAYLKKLDPKYYVFQYEKGEKGTYHLQGFLIYRDSKRFINVVQDLLTAHITPADENNYECRNYCTKTETRVAGPFEYGEFAELRARTDVVQFHEDLEKGATNMELKHSYPNLYSQYGPDKIEKFRQDYLKDKQLRSGFVDRRVTYIYGKTRLGKTSYIYEHYKPEDVCRVVNYERGTFEGYTNQKVLVLDEFTGQIDINYLNNILDKYFIDLSARYANRVGLYEEVYIISNFELVDIYTDEKIHKPEVYNAFLARIHRIIHFTDVGKFEIEFDCDDANTSKTKYEQTHTCKEFPF